MIFFSDLDQTFQIVSDPDPDSDPSGIFSKFLTKILPLYFRLVSVLGCILRRDMVLYKQFKGSFFKNGIEYRVPVPYFVEKLSNLISFFREVLIQ